MLRKSAVDKNTDLWKVLVALHFSMYQSANQTSILTDDLLQLALEFFLIMMSVQDQF